VSPAEPPTPDTPPERNPGELTPSQRGWLRATQILVFFTTPPAIILGGKAVVSLLRWRSAPLGFAVFMGGVSAASFVCGFLSARLDNKTGRSLVKNTLFYWAAFFFSEFLLTILAGMIVISLH
jgi:hypothetical protein